MDDEEETTSAIPAISHETSRSHEVLRPYLDASGVGEEVGASMAAVRAIVVGLAARIGGHPHVLPALDIIHEVATLAVYLRVATAGGDVIEFEPGRTIQEVRTVLATMPPDEAGDRLALAVRILGGAVQKDSNRTTVYVEPVVRDVLRIVADAAGDFSTALDETAKTRIASTTADLLMHRTGTRPPMRLVEDALGIVGRRGGRPKGSKTVLGLAQKARRDKATLHKHEVLEQLLIAVGYEVANVYDYMPGSGAASGARREATTKSCPLPDSGIGGKRDIRTASGRV
jgi:hypothetical protein